MKIICILPFIIGVATGQGLFGLPSVPNIGLQNFNPLPSIPLLNNVRDFGDFVAKTGKTYADSAEQTFRAGVFAAKEAVVDSNNKAFELGHSAFKLGINAFSDLTNSEFLSRLTGYKRTGEGDAKVEAYRSPAPEISSANIPDSFDWRQRGGVTPVKFQGLDCNSCWSFAVTAAIEGHYFRKSNSLVSLSEQNLIDCSASFGNTGCDGGYQEYGFSYVIDNNGLAKNDKYPYKMQNGDCYYNNDLRGANVKSFAVIEPGNEEEMKKVIATLGPLACSINAGGDKFQLYKEGIYDDEDCNKGEVNHSVSVVGYGTENGKDYWIVKNSWTDKWGEAGFVRIARDNNGGCGIKLECSYPLL